MYRKNNNILATMITNQLFNSYYGFKQKFSTPFNRLNYKTEDKQMLDNTNKYLQNIKKDSQIIQKERRESMLLLCLLEKTINKRTKGIYRICKNLEKNLSKW